MLIRTPAAVLAVLSVLVGVSPAGADVGAALEGSWTVAQATVNGKGRGAGKVLNSTWTFRGAELVVQNVRGERLRSALSFEAGAEPPAFHVTPLDQPGERPLWMIVARQGGELRLAFYDGVDRRPEDFGPRPKLVVLTLVPAPTTRAAALDPCEILRVAGADVLLRGATRAQPGRRDSSAPGPSCALESGDGSGTVSLTLVASPAGSGYFDAARHEARDKWRGKIEDEPVLGADAFWLARGWTIVVVAVRRGTAMVLRFEASRAERAELRRFAERVLDRL